MAKRIVLILLALCAFPSVALAVPCSQIFTFATGQVLTAANLNANPANEVNCINNVDHTNVGAAGLYASQIIPTNAGQAAFGGSQTYAFPNGIQTSAISAPGNLAIATGAGNVVGVGSPIAATEGGTAVEAYVAPTYNTSGVSVAITLHAVQFTCNLVTNACNMTLTGAAAFTSAATYACTMDYNVAAVSIVPLIVNNTSGTTFTVGNPGGATSSIPVTGICVGT